MHSVSVKPDSRQGIALPFSACPTAANDAFVGCHQVVPEDSRASVLSADAAVTGSISTVDPLLAALLYQRFGLPALGMFGASMTAVMVLLVQIGVISV